MHSGFVGNSMARFERTIQYSLETPIAKNIPSSVGVAVFDHMATRSSNRLRTGRAHIRVALALMIAISMSSVQAQDLRADPANSGVAPWLILTESPRDTLSSFAMVVPLLREAIQTYIDDQSLENVRNVQYLTRQLISLLDLSEVPEASYRHVGVEAASALIDIFDVIGQPEILDAPGNDRIVSENTSTYRIPETPFKIRRILEGPRKDEFLFDTGTVEAALLLRDQLTLAERRFSLQAMQLTGPLIPLNTVQKLPSWLQAPVLGTLLWKVIFAAFALFAAIFALLKVKKIPITPDHPDEHPNLMRRLLRPAASMAMILVLNHLLLWQLNLSGTMARATDIGLNALSYCVVAWITWIVILWFLDRFLVDRAVSDQGLDASMLRLISRIIALASVVVILAHGANALGVPVFSILAGLGIGGLAIALAIRPTLENLIGGIILYLDKPIRVGDFCGFSGQTGVVESIGTRSTKIRALDRTLVSIPNAQFADMQLVNWAECDEMLIKQTIGLRYETGYDQLLFVLAKIREMAHAHPKINSDTVRVRFVQYGSSSLDVSIRLYARTREWNEYFGIQEDILMRIKGIVEHSGTGFAFPSQTLYLSRDDGTDNELTINAEREVENWRRSGKLPFPNFGADTLQELRDTLTYPPFGSPAGEYTDDESTAGTRESSSSESVQSNETNDHPDEPEAQSKKKSRDN